MPQAAAAADTPRDLAQPSSPVTSPNFRVSAAATPSAAAYAGTTAAASAECNNPAAAVAGGGCAEGGQASSVTREAGNSLQPADSGSSAGLLTSATDSLTEQLQLMMQSTDSPSSVEPGRQLKQADGGVHDSEHEHQQHVNKVSGLGLTHSQELLQQWMVNLEASATVQELALSTQPNSPDRLSTAAFAASCGAGSGSEPTTPVLAAATGNSEHSLSSGGPLSPLGCSTSSSPTSRAHMNRFSKPSRMKRLAWTAAHAAPGGDGHQQQQLELDLPDFSSAVDFSMSSVDFSTAAAAAASPRESSALLAVRAAMKALQASHRRAAPSVTPLSDALGTASTTSAQPVEAGPPPAAALMAAVSPRLAATATAEAAAAAKAVSSLRDSIDVAAGAANQWSAASSPNSMTCLPLPPYALCGGDGAASSPRME